MLRSALQLIPVMALAASAAPAAEYLIVCSGQSNMDGRVPAEQRPATLAVMPPNVRYYIGAASNDKPMRPRVKLVDDKERFGPVPECLLTLSASRPADTFIAVKVAVGATALWQWVPDYDAGTSGFAKGAKDQANGHLYEGLAKAIAQARAAHPRAIPLAALWLQGEADHKPEQAAIYLPNLRRLVANLRRDMGSATLAFIAAEPGSGQAQVYAAFPALAAEDPRAFVVRAKDLSHMDNAHYDLAAITTIGQRYAAALHALLPR